MGKQNQTYFNSTILSNHFITILYSPQNFGCILCIHCPPIQLIGHILKDAQNYEYLTE